jgi:hypothetical protein
MFRRNQLLESLTKIIFGPSMPGEELLQRARHDVGVQSGRLDALLGQVGELPANIDAQVCTTVLTTDGNAEVTERLAQLRL